MDKSKDRKGKGGRDYFKPDKPSTKRKSVIYSPNKSANGDEDQEQDTQHNSPLIDVTGTESELSETGVTDTFGHHEEWQFPSLENSGVSSEDSSSENNTGHITEKQSEKKREFIKKFLNEAEAVFKAGEERLNMASSCTKVSILDDDEDDDITEAADLVHHYKRKQSQMNPLLLYEKHKPFHTTTSKLESSGLRLLSSSDKLMFGQNLPNRNKLLTDIVKDEVSDSVVSPFNFTLTDSEQSLLIVEHIKPSAALKVNQKKRKKQKGSLENHTKNGGELQTIPELENLNGGNKKKEKKINKDNKKVKEENGGEEEDLRRELMKDQEDKDRNKEIKEKKVKKVKEEFIKKRRGEMIHEEDRAVNSLACQSPFPCNTPELVRSKGKKHKKVKKTFETSGKLINDSPVICPTMTRDKKQFDDSMLIEDTSGIHHEILADESECITAEAKLKKKKENNVNIFFQKKPDISEVIFGEINSDNTVLSAVKTKKKKKKRDSEVFDDAPEIIEVQQRDNVKDSAIKIKRQKHKDLLLVETAPGIPVLGDHIEDPVNRKEKKKRKMREDVLVVEDTLKLVEVPDKFVNPEFHDKDVPKKKKKKKVQDRGILDGPSEIIANCAHKINKKGEVSTGIFAELSDSVTGTGKKRKKHNIQDISPSQDILEVVENLLNEPDASLAGDKYQKKKRRKVHVKWEPLDQKPKSCITSTNASNHTPDMFDDLLKPPKDPVEKTVKKSKKTRCQDESVHNLEKQQVSFTESREGTVKSKIKKGKVKELKDMPCADIASSRKSQGSSSPWHRLSRDSNGSFTGCSGEIYTNSFQGSSQNNACCADNLGTQPKKKKEVRVQAESTNEEILNVEPVLNSARMEDSFSLSYSSCSVANKDTIVTSSSGKEMIAAGQNNVIIKPAISHEVSYKSSSESEVQVSGRGNMRGLTQRIKPHQLVPSISSSFEESSEYETLVPGRGNLKELTQKLEFPSCASKESTPSQWGAEKLCKTKTVTKVVRSKTETLPTDSLRDRLSTKINEADSDSSDTESIRVSGRGNLRGLTQKLPSKGPIHNATCSDKSFEHEPLVRSQSLSSLDQHDEPVFKQKQTLESKENIPKAIPTRKSISSYETLNAETVKCTRCKSHFISALLLEKHFCYQAPKRRTVAEPHRTGNAPFQCECGLKYTSMHNLNHHISATHNGIRPYKCNTCLMCFSEKQTLMVHQRIHSKTLPFECSICGRCFVVQFNLNRHYKNKHKLVEKYHCNICSRKNVNFYFKKDLDAHIDYVHKKAKVKSLNSLVSL